MRIILMVLLASIIGAIAHERDIAYQCKTKGSANYATWVSEINCSKEQKP